MTKSVVRESGTLDVFAAGMATQIGCAAVQIFARHT